MTVYKGEPIMSLLRAEDPEDPTIATEFDVLIHAHLLENLSENGDRLGEGATMV